MAASSTTLWRLLKCQDDDSDSAKRAGQHHEEAGGDHSAPGPLMAPAAAALKAAAMTATRATSIILSVSRPRVPRPDRRCSPSPPGPPRLGTLP